MSLFLNRIFRPVSRKLQAVVSSIGVSLDFVLCSLFYAPIVSSALLLFVGICVRRTITGGPNTRVLLVVVPAPRPRAEFESKRCLPYNLRRRYKRTRPILLLLKITMTSNQHLKAESLFGLDGKVALVTGGGTGIGLMIAKGLAVNGAIVYIASRRRGVVEKAADDFNTQGGGGGKLVA